ncbi:MAG: hypothetical protein QM723_28225 [Myxococcaceae bacterium]
MGISVQRQGPVTRITFFPMRNRIAPWFAGLVALITLFFCSERIIIRCHRGADLSCRVHQGTLFGLLGSDQNLTGITAVKVETGKADGDGVRTSAIYVDSAQGRVRLGYASNVDVDTRQETAQRLAQLTRPGAPEDLDLDVFFPTTLMVGGAVMLFTLIALAFIVSFGKAGLELDDVKKTLSAFEGRAVWPGLAYDALDQVTASEEKDDEGQSHVLIRLTLKDASERKLVTGYLSRREADRAVAEISERLRQ